MSVAWIWNAGKTIRWTPLHLLDPGRPGFTLCNALAVPVEGCPAHGHVYGQEAERVAVGRCDFENPYGDHLRACFDPGRAL